ncbi:MAG: sulfite exporter TauE/SafE family protein [Desulfobulbaceae bacterium]|nr:sulfite exporter TauE/SafE family protein [Desulfobulbaceae bacterium]
MFASYPVQLAALFAVGILAGFINTVAGGGSFLTLPLLIFMGLPASVANGTNRLAILLQSVAGMGKFHSSGVFPWRFALVVSVPAVAGALLGAHWAVGMGDEAFKRWLALFMVVMTFVSLYKPKGRLAPATNGYSPRRWLAILASFFVIGLYGGFIQAGVGFLLLAGMAFTDSDLVRGNAVKVFVVFLFTLFAMGIFIANHKVDYGLGVVLGLGSAIGAWVGARASVKGGSLFIRRFVMAMMVLFAVKLLWG